MAVLVKKNLSDEQIASKLHLSARWIRELRYRTGIKYPAGRRKKQEEDGS
ncbi:hypothetical protein KW792_01625 [Candidatus Saccharibacteria bacterium]|nr:hypothetical protein [Candidatus Saccharibacteria bacterium]